MQRFFFIFITTLLCAGCNCDIPSCPPQTCTSNGYLDLNQVPPREQAEKPRSSSTQNTAQRNNDQRLLEDEKTRLQQLLNQINAESKPIQAKSAPIKR